MQRKISFAPGEYYHLYNRGVEKKNIFLDDRDYSRFQKMLYICNNSKPVVFKTIQGLPLDKIERSDRNIAIGAYTLMPNHVHILVKETKENGLSNFMSKLMTGYSMYFNKKYQRVGPLFQGRFKAEHVARDEYLKYMFAYIHLNPVKLIDPNWRERGLSHLQKTKNYLRKYKWSSCMDYLDIQREEKLILNTKEFPKYFKDKPSFANFLKDWLEFKSDF